MPALFVFNHPDRALLFQRGPKSNFSLLRDLNRNGHRLIY